MAEQNVHVTGIEAESVTVAPTQINYAPAGEALRGWSEALLRGPVRQAGQEDRAAEAERAAEAGEHDRAARAYLEVAAGLSDHGFGPAADKYRQRAAGALAAAGRAEHAFAVYMDLTRHHLDSGELTARGFAHQAAKAAPAHLAWKAAGMKARANWPEQEDGDVEALRRAWEEASGGPEEAEWAAALVELLLLNGEEAEALAVASDVVGRLPRAIGPRLAVELDRCDLLARLGRGQEADAARVGLREWAGDPDLAVEVAALVHQREAVALAEAGTREEARKAFMRSLTFWARERSFNDQLAEAFFSALTAASLLGDHEAAFDDAIPIARDLRGTADTATSACQRLMRRGFKAISDGSHPDALRYFATAYNLARRAGNLSDFLEAAEGLGDVLLAGRRPQAALSTYVQAGVLKKAQAAAAGMSVDLVLDSVPLDGAPWQRRAAWAAVVAAGRLAGDEAAATVGARALAQLTDEPAEAFPINTSYYALEAIANMICALPDDQLPAALEELRRRLARRIGEPRSISQPLLMVTLCGRADEAASVVEAMLADDLQAAQQPGTLEPLLRERPEEARRIVEAAEGGDRRALDFLVFTDFFEEHPRLVELGREAVRAASRSGSREVTIDGGTRTVAYGIGGDLAPIGRFAAYAPEDERRLLVDRLLAELDDPDPEMPIMNRVAAVQALHNLAPALPGDIVSRVAEALARHARKADEPSEWDRLGVDDPLARFRIDMAPKDALQTSALEALAATARNHAAVVPILSEALEAAVVAANPRLLRSALVALALNPGLEIGGVDPIALLRHEDDAVRLAAMEVALERRPENLLAHAPTLVKDPSFAVRTRLVGMAAALPGAGGVLADLADDSDTYTRAMARKELGDTIEDTAR